MVGIGTKNEFRSFRHRKLLKVSQLVIMEIGVIMIYFFWNIIHSLAHMARFTGFFLGRHEACFFSDFGRVSRIKLYAQQKIYQNVAMVHVC